MARAIWIWESASQSFVAVLVHQHNVLNAHWDPKASRIAMCTGADRLFLWSPEGGLCVPTPAMDESHLLDLLWHPNGESLLLLGATSFMVAYL
jgi:hypothetical protein